MIALSELLASNLQSASFFFWSASAESFYVWVWVNCQNKTFEQHSTVRSGTLSLFLSRSRSFVYLLAVPLVLCSFCSHALAFALFKCMFGRQDNSFWYFPCSFATSRVKVFFVFMFSCSVCIQC